MTPIAEDFAGIAEAMLAIADEEPAVCPKCEGGGWECYGLGYADPHFRVCDECYNPEGLPCP